MSKFVEKVMLSDFTLKALLGVVGFAVVAVMTIYFIAMTAQTVTVPYTVTEGRVSQSEIHCHPKSGHNNPYAAHLALRNSPKYVGRKITLAGHGGIMVAGECTDDEWGFTVTK